MTIDKDRVVNVLCGQIDFLKTIPQGRLVTERFQGADADAVIIARIDEMQALVDELCPEKKKEREGQKRDQADRDDGVEDNVIDRTHPEEDKIDTQDKEAHKKQQQRLAEQRGDVSNPRVPDQKGRGGNNEREGNRMK